jgi:hypothetical protein
VTPPKTNTTNPPKANTTIKNNTTTNPATPAVVPKPPAPKPLPSPIPPPKVNASILTNNTYKVETSSSDKPNGGRNLMSTLPENASIPDGDRVFVDYESGNITIVNGSSRIIIPGNKTAVVADGAPTNLTLNTSVVKNVS